MCQIGFRWGLVALLVAPTLLPEPAAAADGQGHVAVAPATTAGMVEFIRACSADEYSVRRFYDLAWSEVQFDRLERFYQDWLGRLAAVDVDALDVTGRVDYVLLRNDLERSRAGQVRARQRLAELEPLLGFRRTINDLEHARWRGEAVDSQAVAGRLAEVSEQAKTLKQRVDKGRKSADKDKPDTPADKPAAGAADAGGKAAAAAGQPADDKPALALSPALALRAAGAVGQLQATLRRWYEFYAGYQPEFSWWVKAPYEEAGRQLEEYAKFLREEVAGQKGKDEDPLVGEPLGAEALAEALRFEFLPYTADELIAIGERDLAWCEGEMRKAAQALGCGDDWKAAMARVKADFAPPGGQDELVAQTARDAIAFTKQHRFATVPPLCEETWRMTMMAPETLKTIPYAAYGDQGMQVAYAREDMKQEDKLMVMRGNNRAFTRLTVPHELIPGHHLQRFQGDRHMEYRDRFGTPFSIEGWALYSELRFWALGWPRTPQEKIGMLFWRMNRAARIIVSLRFQLGRLQPDEMVDFLVERVGHERFAATGEVRRFIHPQTPRLYQAAYMIGGKQLLALHAEQVPARQTEQAFNDAVLTAGPIPVELLRAQLRGLPLGRDAQPGWRFAGE